MKKKRESREHDLRVPVTPDEYALIKGNADAVNQTIAGYLRAIGCGYRVKSKLDIELTREFIKAAGDMGRIGGLLKLALSEGDLADGDKAREILDKMLALHISLLALIDRFQHEKF